MAQAKKNTGKSAGRGKSTRTSARRKAEPAAPEVPAFLQSEVVLILSFAAAVLLFLSNFKLCGTVGGFFRSLQLGLFGIVGFVFPLLLFTGICFYLVNRGTRRAIIKILAVTAGVLALCGILHLLFGVPPAPADSLFSLYALSAENGTGGGLTGGLLASGLVRLLGTPGAYVVLFVLLILSGVLITEKSVVTVVKKGGNQAYQYAVEDAKRRKEVRARREEEKQRLREEKIVRGVDLESTKILNLASELEQGVEPGIKLGPESGTQPGAGLAMTPEHGADLGPASIFSGNIQLPPELAAEEVPFEPDETDTDDELSGASPPQPLSSDPKAVPPDLSEYVIRGQSVSVTEEDEDEHLFVPEEPKRVVTAGGKIIESETALLHKKIEKKRQEAAAEGTDLAVEEEIKAKEKIKIEYKFPPLTLLNKGRRGSGGFSDQEYRATAVKLQQTLRNFGVGVTVTNISCGPTVTRYELHPEQGVKVSRIVGLADDIKLNLAAEEIRIEAPIPGKAAVGIEVPNKENAMVYLRDLLESDNFRNHSSSLAFAVGKDIGGQTVVADIGKMPHLLIAGATGSGKSVCINTLIISIIYKSDPEDVKLIMIDPKVVELSVYNGIPHLLIPVVTDPKKASGALNWAVAEMTDRYKKFADYNVRDLKGYNEKIRTIQDLEDEHKPGKLPQIIIIVDELADLMMVAPGEVEDAICRLAQMARAAGIHLVIATQRPSVNVITGLIKANVPSRIAFSVSSGVDSRTIIDMNGAEKLLGKGDMLFYPAAYPKPQRVQGAFVSDKEVSKVVDFLTSQGLSAQYDRQVESQMMNAPAMAPAGGSQNQDEYFVQAGKFIIEKEKASIGMLQRVFKIGFNRAARIMDQLAEAGVVGEEEGTKPRKVLMSMEEFDELMNRE